MEVRKTTLCEKTTARNRPPFTPLARTDTLNPTKLTTYCPQADNLLSDGPQADNLLSDEELPDEQPKRAGQARPLNGGGGGGVKKRPKIDKLQPVEGPMSTLEQYDEAIALKESGKMDEAVSKLEQIAQDDPNFALAHAALSVFYQQLGRNDDAVAEAKKVCELEPNDPFSYMSMSLVCQKAGHIPEAEQALAQAMEKQFASRKSDT